MTQRLRFGPIVKALRRFLLKSRPIALCAIAKDEATYIEEWAAFHLAVGFDTIIIYDNESKDDIGALFKIGRWPEKIIVKPWPTRPGVSPQKDAYNDCLRMYGGLFEYLAFLDLDEFLNLKRHPSVRALVDAANADAIGINWRMFGSSHQSAQADGFVIDRFPQASQPEYFINAHIKTIAKSRWIAEAGVHNSVFRKGCRFVSPSGKPRVGVENAWQEHIETDIAQINHYFTKSREEFDRKRARGRADMPPERTDRFRGASEFEAYDRNEMTEKSILRWRPAMVSMLETMRGGR